MAKTYGPIYQMVEQYRSDLYDLPVSEKELKHVGMAIAYLRDLLPKIEDMEPVWVSVEDRLPDAKYYKEYLVSTQGFTTSLYFDLNSKEWKNDEGIPISYITHWMPLPNPPTND